MVAEKLLESKRIDASRMGLRSWRPDWLQCFNSMKWFTAVFSLASLTQSIVVSGLTTLNLQTLETEFGLSSKATGFIMAGNDISALFLVTMVSFFGSKASKPKWMGIGSAITGIGVLLFALPKLMIGKHHVIGGKSNMLLSSMCIPPMGNSTNSINCNTDSSGDTIGHMAVFIISQLLMGVGTTPLYTLGPTYLDENVSPRAAPIYIGIWFCFTMLGPPLGMLIGSLFLEIYTDIDNPQNLDPKDPRWLGAWWLGYVSFSGIFVIMGVFLCLFPKQMNNTQKFKRDKSIKMGHLPAEDKIQYTLKGYLLSTLALFKNQVFLLAVTGLTVKMIYTIGLISFFIKFLIIKFGVEPSKAGQTLGLFMIPSLIVGVMIGSCLLRRIKVELAAKTAAKICLIISFITSFNSFMFVMPGCNNTNLAGIMTSYGNETTIAGSLLNKCNSRCGCKQSTYLPLCGSDGKTYHSPCLAGCTTMTFELKDNAEKPLLIFGNCSCIPAKKRKASMFGNFTMTMPPGGSRMQKMGNMSPERLKKLPPARLAMVKKMLFLTRQTFFNEAIVGKCDRDCKNFYLFMVLCIVLIVVSFIGSTPHKIMVLRSVPDNQRAFALGAQFLIMRAVSFLPGPIFMGWLIDSNCISWGYNSCGKKTSCYDYNIDKLSWTVTWLGVITGAIGTVLYFFAWKLYPDSGKQVTKVSLLQEEEVDENKNGGENIEM